jgi:Alginate lyase
MRRLMILAIMGIVVAARSAATPVATTPVTTPSPSGTAPAVTALHPGDLLDLNDWYLTLPTGASGKPDTITEPALATYSSTWFTLDEARNGIVFTADAGGVTTVGSTYPRSELREMNGTTKAAWSNTTGTHTMRLRQAVLVLPPVKPEVVTAQIHDAVSDVVEIRLEATTLLAQYNDGHTDVTLDPDYVLGTPYDLQIVATAGRIEISYNGVLKADIPQTGSGWYFKTGSYLQSNPSRGERPDAVAAVVLYSAQVTHTP